MTDREKVIKESEEAVNMLAKAEEPTFWMDFVRCAFENAIALLKEQEPVEPVRMHHTEHKQTDNYRCKYCGNDMYFEQMYCDCCGRKVKWE